MNSGFYIFLRTFRHSKALIFPVDLWREAVIELITRQNPNKHHNYTKSRYKTNVHVSVAQVLQNASNCTGVRL